MLLCTSGAISTSGAASTSGAGGTTDAASTTGAAGTSGATCTTGADSTTGVDKMVLKPPVIALVLASYFAWREHMPKISTSWKKIAQIYLPDLPLFPSLDICICHFSYVYAFVILYASVYCI